MFYKEILSVIAVVLTFIAFVPYIRSILRNRTRPHVFSWIIWGSTTFIVFLAQLDGGGGVGAWPIGISGIITLYIAFLAFVRTSDKSITQLDWLFFSLTMASLPLWFFTNDALWAVVLLTTVDLLGFGPTVRKAYFQPFEEEPIFFFIFMLRNILVIFALEQYSMTTVLFPAAIASACFCLILLLIIRRRVVSKENNARAQLNE